MKFISLLLLLPTLCLGAGMKKEGSMILPFEINEYPIEKFVEDYANIMSKTILTEKGLSKSKINLVVNQKVNIQNFEKMFLTILESHGYATISDGSFLRVIEARDVRYAPTRLYESQSFPKNDQFIIVYHQLKNPLSRDITRNMRPFMSRYGRIIDFSDAHSIVIQDRGKNIDRLLKLIDSLDNKDGVKRLTANKGNRKKKKQLDKEELELEILKLQKRKLESELEKNSSHGRKGRS